MDRPWATLTRVALLGALVFVVVSFRDYGLSWDEEHSAQNGEYAAAWFWSLGHDQRVLTAFHQHLYGSFFNLSAYLAAVVSPIGRYETEHLLIALLAWVGLVFAFRLARLGGGARAGFFALLFLGLTPAWVGHAFMNPKDVPLAALFVVAGFYLARAVTELPTPSHTTLAAFAVATGLAAGIRVIGTFLLGYWGLALAVWWLATLVGCRSRPRWWTIASWWGVPALAAWSIMVVFWPYAQLDPIRNPIGAFFENTHFAFNGATLFDGRTVSPTDLPWSYLPTWFAISLPEFYACGIAGALVPSLAFLAGAERGTRARTIGIVLLLVVMAFLPPALAIWRRAVMYDGMRHFLFIVPILAVLAGWGFAAAVGELQALGRRRSVAGVLRAAIALVPVAAGAASIALTVADLRALHPYEYIYFNRLVGGGQRAASARFETDYWGLSYKEGLDWLRDHYPAQPGRVTVANCSIDFLTSYWIRNTPELAARFTPTALYTNPPPHILLATTRYDCHRSGGTPIHVVERAGVPLMYVLERDDHGTP
jgi:hypothetical protein